MKSHEQGREHRMRNPDWYSQCDGNLWSNEVLPLLFACGWIIGLAYGHPIAYANLTNGPVPQLGLLCTVPKALAGVQR
jgi:hypothetical protein